ncbi:MAG: DUF4433 domain-containing protein [Gemmatimonadetes bacterium]|nr:DUF4433 domain-containing protein [Gemmatimonadota bacterium]
MSEELLDYYEIDGLYQITHADHLQTIFRYGLLSHNNAHELGLVQHDISNPDVQNRRAERCIGGRPLHDYVPLYFNPRNAMLFDVLKKHAQEDIVFLRLSRKLMFQKGVWFTDGNATNKPTLSYDSLKDLDKLDWECIRAEYWINYEDGTRKCMAEILIPDKISANYIKRKSHIFVENQETRDRVEAILPNVRVAINMDLYFV